MSRPKWLWVVSDTHTNPPAGEPSNLNLNQIHQPSKTELYLNPTKI